MKPGVATIILGVLAAFVQADLFNDGKPIDWYDCRGVPNGDLVHPVDCTRFITCSNELAYERECAICTTHPVNCPHGRLVFDMHSRQCEWAHLAECGSCKGSGGNRLY